MVDVFVSVHVASLRPTGEFITSELRKCGINAWICTESLVGGDSYRDEIVRAVKGCKVFLPLINAEWAQSGECKDEYSLAKRLNLTCYERGVAKYPAPRQPVLVPVSFPNLIWDAHPHIELLAASTNFIVSSNSAILARDEIFDQILRALVALQTSGLHFATSLEKYSGISGSVNRGNIESLREKHVATALDTRSLASSLLDMLDLQRQTIMSLLATMPSGHQPAVSANVVFPEERREQYSPKMLRSRYLGTQAWGVHGDKITGADSFEFSLIQGADAFGLIEVSGEVVWRRIRVSDDDRARQDDMYNNIAAVLKDDLKGVEQVRGTFDLRKGLLILEGKEKSRDRGADFSLSHKFHLLLNHDGAMLSGTSQVQGDVCSIRARGF